MKRFLPLFIIVLALSSCQEDVKFSTPGFQGLKDDVFWRAADARAYIDLSGKLKIEALTQYETLTLNTSSPNVGTYVLGVANSNNSATYASNFDDIDLEYATLAVPGPVADLGIFRGGSGYTTGNGIATTGGSGSGLTVNIVTNNAGVVTSVVASSRGNGYKSADVITVAGGNLDCKIVVQNVQNSKGQIIIKEYDNVNQTVSGTFKFDAVNANDNPLGSPILNFQYGEFYKVPIYPAL